MGTYLIKTGSSDERKQRRPHKGIEKITEGKQNKKMHKKSNEGSEQIKGQIKRQRNRNNLIG